MKMVLLFGLIVMCCSCNTYQYITVSSSDLQQNKLRQFEMENDTLRLTYDFNGRNGPVKLTVFNKLDKPLVLDLNKSALIINGHAVGFYSGKIELNGTLQGSDAQLGGSRVFVSKNGVVSGTATLPPGMIFIPAGTYVTETPLVITDKNLDNIGLEKFLKQRYNEGGSDEYSARTAGFTRDSSPLVFKSYITFVQADKDEFTQQHTFYVSEVKQTTVSPSTLNYNSSEGDHFYVSKANQGAGIAGLTVGLAAVVVLAAVAANNRGGDK